MARDKAGGNTGTNDVPESHMWTDDELQLQHERFVAALEATLDVDAGLVDALRHLEHDEFVSRISDGIDVEAGLESALGSLPEAEKTGATQDVQSPADHGGGGDAERRQQHRNGSSRRPPGEGPWRATIAWLRDTWRRSFRAQKQFVHKERNPSHRARPRVLLAVIRILPTVIFGRNWQTVVELRLQHEQRCLDRVLNKSTMKRSRLDKEMKRLRKRLARERKQWRRMPDCRMSPRSVEAQIFRIIDHLTVLRAILKGLSRLRFARAVELAIVDLQHLQENLRARTMTLEDAIEDIDRVAEVFTSGLHVPRDEGPLPLIASLGVVVGAFSSGLTASFLGSTTSLVLGSIVTPLILLIGVGFLAYFTICRSMLPQLETLRSSVKRLFDPSQERV